MLLLTLLHPLLQGSSRDPYRSTKTDHRQSLLCDEFIDLAAAQSQSCCHAWDAQQQRLCWRSLEIFHGCCFFHRWMFLFLPVQVRAADVLHAGRFTVSNACAVASS